MNESTERKHEQLKRDSDATSKETLEDIEESEKVSNTERTDERSVTSPDGAFDQEKELKEADPM